MPHLFYTPPPPKPGEWQIDEHGRKYRRVGNSIEYMGTVSIYGVDVENTQEAIAEFHANMKASRENLEEKERQREAQKQTKRKCPFNRFFTYTPDCEKTCALYRENGCTMRRREAAQDTKGKPCPFMRKCAEDCALYNGGCTL